MLAFSREHGQVEAPLDRYHAAHALSTHRNRLNIDEATDGTEAFALSMMSDYALVISDRNMSPMSGIELLAKMRAHPRTEKIPFIMVTTRSQTTYSSLVRDEDGRHYLEKPFTADQLMECVRSAPLRIAAA